MVTFPTPCLWKVECVNKVSTKLFLDQSSSRSTSVIYHLQGDRVLNCMFARHIGADKCLKSQTFSSVSMHRTLLLSRKGENKYQDDIVRQAKNERRHMKYEERH